MCLKYGRSCQRRIRKPTIQTAWCRVRPGCEGNIRGCVGGNKFGAPSSSKKQQQKSYIISDEAVSLACFSAAIQDGEKKSGSDSRQLFIFINLILH